ncbi:MAG: cytidylate kinase family protein [Candidatus Pacearchaeota archaeon]|jgi:cytidylate kinase
MKISVSGIIGSGKSSVAKILAEKLKYNYYSVGGFMREIALKRGISIHELSKLAEKTIELDEELDNMQKNLNNKDNLVMDSRLGFYFLPSSYKIFLIVSLDEAARRILDAKRGDEPYSNLEECEEYIKTRANSEKIRYKQYYNIDFPNLSDFDLVIDTTNKPIEEVIEEILRKVEERKGI